MMRSSWRLVRQVWNERFAGGFVFRPPTMGMFAPRPPARVCKEPFPAPARVHARWAGAAQGGQREVKVTWEAPADASAPLSRRFPYKLRFQSESQTPHRITQV